MLHGTFTSSVSAIAEMVSYVRYVEKIGKEIPLLFYSIGTNYPNIACSSHLGTLMLNIFHTGPTKVGSLFRH